MPIAVVPVETTFKDGISTLTYKWTQWYIFFQHYFICIAIDAEFTGLHTTDGSQPRYCIMNIEPLFVRFQEGKCKKKASGVASGPKQGERVGLRSNLILWKPGWRSGESTCLPPMFCGFKSQHMPYLGWVCGLFFPLLREVFLWVLQFSPPLYVSKFEFYLECIDIYKTVLTCNSPGANFIELLLKCNLQVCPLF